ncbi:MAG TPA: universal stress protein [Xanthobacteraceae bacterium]|nr:universal stress protein [Xanthobacteraceae bacterium]
MSYAVIMVHTDVDESFDACLRLGSQLARRFSATLIGTSAALVPAEYGPYLGAAGFAEEQRGVGALLARREAALRQVAEAAGIPHEWRSDDDLPDDFVAREARAADLVVVGRVAASASVLRAVDPGRVLLRAGRPVLVVPPGIESLRAERIVIGWKDAREARRAVSDALPFLHEAKRVRIVEIREPGADARAQRRLDDVAHYLMRHRVAADTQVLTQSDHEVAGALIGVAQADGADLIVAGAYGQSRLGEWVFGGVTRRLLSASPICCLFSH